MAGSNRSGGVIEILRRLISQHGTPRYPRSDKGPESVSKALLRWLVTANIDAAMIDPDEPWKDGADEAFNSNFRFECSTRL